MNPHPDWIVPQWPAPAGVKALITTRAGGASTGAFASFNLGLRAGDDPLAVTENRARLRRLLPQEPKWLQQVHGSRVVDADNLAGTMEADASYARGTGTVCSVMIADCLPVLLCDRAGSVVAAAHAGWRGLCGGVIENTVAAMRAAGVAPDTMLAYLGPAIGPGAFEVGADVYHAFVQREPEASQAFSARREGKWLADLFLLARLALARAGVHLLRSRALFFLSPRQDHRPHGRTHLARSLKRTVAAHAHRHCRPVPAAAAACYRWSVPENLQHEGGIMPVHVPAASDPDR